MRKFIIDKNGDGQRLDKFMQRVMPEVKMSEIYKSLRKKKVRVNGKHKDGAYRLSANDEVCMYINDEFFESGKNDFSWLNASDDIKVVYEDENILIADKPSGMPSQDSDSTDDSLESRIRAYLYKKGEVDLKAKPLFIPSLCHRIDRNTDGLVIAAKNPSALRIVNQKIKDKEIRKFYLCETENTPNPPEGEICGWLVRDGGGRKMIFSPKETLGSSRCETIYKTIRKGTPALVEAELLTGKTHQIRAGFSYLNCPLVGDVKYGAKLDGGRDFQRLTSYKIVFAFKTAAGELEYLKNKVIEKSFRVNIL